MYYICASSIMYCHGRDALVSRMQPFTNVCLVPCASNTSDIQFIRIEDLCKSTWKQESVVSKASNHLFWEQTIGSSTFLHQTSKMIPSLHHRYLYESRF